MCHKDSMALQRFQMQKSSIAKINDKSFWFLNIWFLWILHFYFARDNNDLNTCFNVLVL